MSCSRWSIRAPQAREPVAAELKVAALADHRSLLGGVDAVSVVTPTPAHFAIARDFLEAGAHVLVEKPITETPAEARELIALAARVGRILQVGHLERFNSAILAAEPHLRVTALRRVPSPGALPRAGHGRERGARSDDP